MLCEDIELVYNEYAKEIKEHKILEKLKKLRTEKDMEKLKEYEEYNKAWLAIKALRDRYCKGKDARVDKIGLRLLLKIWQAEIKRFKFIIVLTGQTKRYKNILASMKRIVKAM